jgi:mono/diheme cytochrome c family protein
MRLAWVMVVGAMTAACGDDASGTDMAAPDLGTAAIDRGRYLANNVGACVFCHTPLNPDGTRDNSRFLGGWDCFFDLDPANPDVGCLSTRNLSNDATGLKNATDEQIKKAFRDGTRTDGKAMAPVMPYWLFHNMTDADADAIVAYLRTVPGVSHVVPANQPPWDNIPAPTPPIDPSTIPTPPSTHPDFAAAMRGRYLAAQAGLCVDCHTPELPPGPTLPIDMTRPFAGGRMFPAQALGFMSPPYPAMITTANLTPDATGLAGWTVQQIKTAIKDGKDRTGGGVCAGTHGLTTSPYAGLTDADVTDIATYITTVPAIMNARTDCVGP